MNVRHAGLWMVVALALACASPVAAHEGHDHAAPEPIASDPNLVVRSASNDRYEVVLKYSSEHGRKSTVARVYVSDFATNAPIDGARVTLRTTSPRQTNATAAPLAPGVYQAELPYEEPGRYTLILAVAAGMVAEFAFQDLPMGEALERAAATPELRAARPRGWSGSSRRRSSSPHSS